MEKGMSSALIKTDIEMFDQTGGVWLWTQGLARFQTSARQFPRSTGAVI